ncbi:MAG: VanZ family protein [Myxococcota bacterium]|nr:VanZ family protein [Myxococcota bacterium]
MPQPTPTKPAQATTASAPSSRVAGAWGLVVVWALLVWGLGGDDLSLEGTSRFLGPLFEFLFPGISGATNERLQWAVRKTAHLTEYALLAALFLRALWLGGRPAGRASAWLAFALAAAFAAADETRQSLSVARLGSIWDVALDATGAALSVVALSQARSRWPALCERFGFPALSSPVPPTPPAANEATGEATE